MSLTSAFYLLIFQNSDRRYKAVRTENTHLKGMMGDLDPVRYLVIHWIHSPELNRRWLGWSGLTISVVTEHARQERRAAHCLPHCPPQWLAQAGTIGLGLFLIISQTCKACSFLAFNPAIAWNPISSTAGIGYQPYAQRSLPLKPESGRFVPFLFDLYLVDLFCGLSLSTWWLSGSWHAQRLRIEQATSVCWPNIWIRPQLFLFS